MSGINWHPQSVLLVIAIDLDGAVLMAERGHRPTSTKGLPLAGPVRRARRYPGRFYGSIGAIGTPPVYVTCAARLTDQRTISLPQTETTLMLMVSPAFIQTPVLYTQDDTFAAGSTTSPA